MTTPAHAALNHWKGTFELYQDPIFAEIFARNYRLKVLDKEGLLVLARKNPLLGYTHAVIGSPEIKGSIEECLTKISSLNCTQLDIHTTRQIPSLSRHLVSPPDNMNMLIDLTEGEEKIFSRFSVDDKKSVLRAFKRGLTIREHQTAREVEAFYKLMVRSSENGKKFDIPSVSFIHELLAARLAKLLLGIYDGQVVGGEFLLLGRDTLFGWYSCIDRTHNKLGVGRAIVYEIVKQGSKGGFRLYDLGQQSLGDNSLARHKMTFNPLLVPAYSYRILSSKFLSRVIRLLKPSS